ncbi:3-methyl-2-oxobutanoate hydroxymethyltransferase [Falsiruegeria litorea R37]|uniref:3-methyl-2-oxobutanoate hydroxymethyltransferase n=1 Tax=Falsiruegeria litorea R37 TaxID=1200284 RepID=A0A1Y5TRH2_9RHOB|nr:3-methyl-2-oxobutanoate hydroxymethyltransferase [Falsiruegeria litorea]SLN70185.1 3-methyl-2-oxobutanoate hydroxymethyltransferase [Falsiruegeria litorea R37]
MKNIYTFGGFPATRNLTVADIRANKVAGRKMTQVTSVNRNEAAACEEMGVDHLSIVAEDIHEVRAGAPNTFVTSAVMMSEHPTPDDILRTAIAAAAAGSDAIYTPRGLRNVEMLAHEGLAVQGHLGLVPRKSTLVGGLRGIAKTADEAMVLMDDVRRLQDAGAYAVEMECVAAEALSEISKRTSLVTHSIGSGSGGDVIFMFMEDICGDVDNPPRHAKAFGRVGEIRKELEAERRRALQAYGEAVKGGAFPDPAISIAMSAGEHDKLCEALDKWTTLHQ